MIFEVSNVDDESMGKSFAEATCEHKNNLIEGYEMTPAAVSSHTPVLSPDEAQKSLITEVKKRGEDVPALALGDTPDFYALLAQTPSVDNDQEPVPTETPEQPSQSAMAKSEDLEPEESDC